MPEATAQHPDSAYQLFPDLTVDEYAALKADIAKRGVLVPVEKDEHGNVLDGHNRVKVCAELGIRDYPVAIRAGMTEDEKVEHVLTLNLARRHLSPSQRTQLEADLRRRGWSFRRIAEKVGVDPMTVHRDLAAVEIATPAKVTGADGKAHPAKKPTPPPTIFATSPRQEARASEALRQLADQAPTKVVDLKRAERIVREKQAEERRAEPVEAQTVVDDIDIRHGDFREVLADVAPGSAHAIITDPPYPAEFVDLFADLGDLGRELLTADGVLAAMVGGMFLPAYLERLGRCLQYRWTAAYLVPGPRSRVHKSRVANGWKPILLYQLQGAAPPFLLDDVFTSEGDDKRFHHWGQSESGIAALVEAFTKPGDLVVDPFLGGGTTAVVCRDLGRRFIGCDIDAAAVAASRERVA